jgi:hypothetical protein
MAGRRHEGDHHACGCARPDGSCGPGGPALDSERVRELAEEIWTASSGRVMPARPALDPRASRPGASAQAAYQRHRQEELTAWRQGWWWRAGALAGATIGGGLLIGLTVGAWLGWPMALAAVLVTGWRLRYRRDGVDTRSCGGGWWPFGRTVVRRADAGAGSTIGSVIWFLIAHRIGCCGMSYRAGASGVLTPSASALPWAASAQMTKMSSVMIRSAQNG